MMTHTMTLTQIRETGLEVLQRELGVVGMIRFIQQFEVGYGDYSKERHLWLENSGVEALAHQIRQRREEYKTV